MGWQGQDMVRASLLTQEQAVVQVRQYMKEARSKLIRRVEQSEVPEQVGPLSEPVEQEQVQPEPEQVQPDQVQSEPVTEGPELLPAGTIVKVDDIFKMKLMRLYLRHAPDL